jgi:ribonuclease P protein component
MVLWLGRGMEAETRVGVVAAKRSFRRSVDRPRAKRLLREAFRQNHFRLRKGLDLILVARTRILNAGGREVEAELSGLAARAGVMMRGE